MKTITKSDGNVIEYNYDAAGNRISESTSVGITTCFVYDASGNMMATYEKTGSSNLIQKDVNMYGSKLLGVYHANVDMQCVLSSETVFMRGKKEYYLENHLGNNYISISDRKIPVISTPHLVDYYLPYIVSAADYSPFGVTLADRQFNSANLKFGFNGKWNDLYSGYQNYGMRDYSGRGRRFDRVDPLTKSYPELTPYQFASNRPIDGTDLDGLEWELSTVSKNLNNRAYLDNQLANKTYTNSHIGPATNSSPPIMNQIHNYYTSGSLKQHLIPGYTLNCIAYNLFNDLKILGSAIVNGGRQATNMVGNRTTEKERVEAFVNVSTTIFGMSETVANQLENKIVRQTKSILNSKEFETIKNAYNNGVPAEVNIRGRVVMYEPDFNYGAAMTLHGENGFLLGPGAFKEGIEHTVLWEITRLNTQGTGSLSVGETGTFTKNAQKMADKLLPRIKPSKKLK